MSMFHNIELTNSGKICSSLVDMYQIPLKLKIIVKVSNDSQRTFKKRKTDAPTIRSSTNLRKN